MKVLPKVIATIKRTPGTYYVTHPVGLALGVYGAVEVDEDGVVHQLTPEGKRYGVLDDDGWWPDVMLAPDELVKKGQRQ